MGQLRKLMDEVKAAIEEVRKDGPTLAEQCPAYKERDEMKQWIEYFKCLESRSKTYAVLDALPIEDLRSKNTEVELYLLVKDALTDAVEDIDEEEESEN